MFLKKWEDLILMAGKSKVLPNNHDARETNFSAIATTLRDTQQTLSIIILRRTSVERCAIYIFISLLMKVQIENEETKQDF